MPARAGADRRRSGREAGDSRLPSPAPALTVRSLVVRFGDTIALDGLRLDVEPGEVTGLVGPNGSGKTTALRVVAGLLRPTAGTAHVAGAAAGTLDARRGCLLVPDEPGGVEELAVDEYVDLVRALYGGGATTLLRAGVLLDVFGLATRRRTQLKALSRGLRRQASMIAGLAVAPPLLLLDEATAALDPEAVILLREALRELSSRGTAVVLATQDLHFAETICRSVHVLCRGRTIASGPTGTVIDRYGAETLEEAFLAAVMPSGLRERMRGGLAAL